MKSIDQLLFTESEIKEIAEHEEAQLLVVMVSNNIGLAVIMSILIGRGITTEEEVSMVMEEVANSDAVKMSAEKIRQLAGLL